LVLKLTPKKGQPYPSFSTDTDGKAAMMLKKDQKYLVNLEAEGFSPITVIYDYNAFGEQFNMVMEPVDLMANNDEIDELEVERSESSDKDAPKLPSDKETVILNTKAGDVLIFENIYFDYNSSAVAKDAVSELDILSNIMRKKEDLTIRIESHTDCRGTSAYNLQLSIKRADAVKDYLITSGIEESRIEIKGYGESKPRNHCKDNVVCKEADHKYNRRTEIVILED
jgi:outer membrane protein OmpA-like peptidoglycan-associated protein